MIETIHVPAFLVDISTMLCTPNAAAAAMLASHRQSVEPAPLSDALRAVEDGMDVVEHCLQCARDARCIRIRLQGARGAFPPFDAVLLPVAGGVAVVQDEPAHHSGDEEHGATLNLLVQERTAEISELNRFLAAIVDSSTETFIIAVGLNGYILTFNEGARLLFGHAASDVVGRLHASELFDDAQSARPLWSQMEQRARQEGKCRELVSLRRIDGSVFPALVDLTLLLNAEHQSLGTLFVGRDVTETIRTQRALEERTKQLEFINMLSLDIGQTLELESLARSALEHLIAKLGAEAGAVFLKNREESDLRLLTSHTSAGAESLLPLLAPSIEDHILVEDGEVLIRDIAAPVVAHETGPLFRLLLPLHPKASFIGVVALLTREPLRRSDELLSFLSAIAATIGGAIENAILYHDSLMKSLEIKKQNQELDEFAYVVSHDLKEPLAGISFISNLITDEYFDKFDETGRAYINSLIDFSKRLGSLIDALLDLSRIGRITQPPERVDIADVLHDVRQNLSYRMASRNIRLEAPENVPTVFGDKTRIEQVFFNLVSNAIKFNDKSEILVRIECQPRDDEFIQFSVADNGIGIEPEYFDKIFNIFERLNPREEYEGTGAGLTIVKKIVEHHGGSIWLDSVLGEGATFHFTLPKFKEPS